MKFAKVSKKIAEKTRRELLQIDAIDVDYQIIQEGEYVLFPLKIKKEANKDFEIVERDATARPRTPAGLKDALKGKLNDEELGELVSSFDIIGDIAIIEIPPKLEKHEKEIGEALIVSHKNVRTVLKKLGAMEGEYRVRRVKHIAGEGKTGTEYRENGIRMRFDVAKVYFSVRLAHERKRIAEEVKKGEKVLVLFAGAGPFAFAIAKKQPKCEIVAIELNPEAARYMKENVALNHFTNIVAVEGDAHEEVMKNYLGWADRIVMPLPHKTQEFLDVAFAATSPNGAIVHFYNIVDMENAFENAYSKVKKEADLAGFETIVVGQRVVRPYSPTQIQVVLDILVKPKSKPKTKHK